MWTAKEFHKIVATVLFAVIQFLDRFVAQSVPALSMLLILSTVVQEVSIVAPAQAETVQYLLLNFELFVEQRS